MDDLNRGVVFRLTRSFALLRATDAWKEKVSGGVYATDCTYGNGTGWHPHLHVIIEVDGWLPDDWIFSIREEWRRITGDSFVVHMRAVNRRCVKELVKYQAKAATFAAVPELVGEYLTAFRNVRRIQCFGSFFAQGAEELPVLALQAEERKGWKCKCGICTADKWKYKRHVHWNQTVLLPSGERRLTLFEEDIGPPGEWVEDRGFEQVSVEKIVHPSLFESAPLFDGAKI